MGVKFVDTSALVKTYRNEPDSPRIQAEILPGDDLIISEITLLEMPSAFYGLTRQRIISLPIAQAFISGFEQDISNYTIIPMSTALLQHARALLASHSVVDGLRPADAIQLASAIEANNPKPLECLLTTDIVLARVAAANGLTVRP